MGANWNGFTVVPEKRVGYGQVEPTHLSAQRTSQIYAQLPADDFDILENGQFVKYNYAEEKCDLEGEGEWMMVWNEIKLYDEREQMYKDYAMIKSQFTPGADIRHDYISGNDFSGYGPFKGQMVPRVIKTNVGDIMITNTLGAPSTNNDGETDIKDELEAKYLTVDPATGFLVAASDASGDFVWAVDTTKKFTMPDGQPAVKIQRIK